MVLIRAQKQFNGGKQAFSTNGAKTTCTFKGKKIHLDLNCTPYMKINSK